MTLTKEIAHNTAIQLIGKTVSVILGLVAVGIMTRHLGVEKFGWYVTATGFLQFIGIISDFGFIPITSSMLAEPKYDKTTLLNTLFTWRFLTGLFFNGLSPLIILFLPYPIHIKLAATILAVSFFCNALNQIFIGYYQTKLKIIIQTTGELIGRLTLVGGLLLIAYGNFNFMPMMAIVALSSMAYTFYLWYKGPQIKFCLDKQISKNIYKKLWPVAIAIIFNAIYLQGDKVILPLYVSQTAMGIYGAAYRVLDVITQSTALVMGLMLPLIAYAWSSKLREEFKKRLQLSFDLILLFVLPMALGAMALATPIMKLIAGDEFAVSGVILIFLCLAVFGIALGMTFGHIALAIGKQRQSMWIYISDAIISLAAYLIFIPRYGIWGAIGVTIFSEFYAGLGLLIICSHYAGYWPKLWTFAKITTASVLMALVVRLIQPLNVIISILIGAAIYTGLILLFKITSKQTVKEIFGSNRS